MTVRYRLDDLGWYQFEQLIQASLKAELGIGIESWGERRDYGRDVYCEGSLKFPSRHLVQDGPFVFQVKFVENANAAGAQYEALIVNALKKEIGKIQERKEEDEWQEPRHYTLLTNASLSASLRERIKATFLDAFPSTAFHSLGGTMFATS